MIFASSGSIPKMAYIADISTGVWCRRGRHMQCPYVCTVCVKHIGYYFQPERRCNHRLQPICGRRQTHFFEVQISVDDPHNESWYSFYRMC